MVLRSPLPTSSRLDAARVIRWQLHELPAIWRPWTARNCHLVGLSHVHIGREMDTGTIYGSKVHLLKVRDYGLLQAFLLNESGCRPQAACSHLKKLFRRSWRLCGYAHARTPHQRSPSQHSSSFHPPATSVGDVKMLLDLRLLHLGCKQAIDSPIKKHQGLVEANTSG